MMIGYHSEAGSGRNPLPHDELRQQLCKNQRSQIRRVRYEYLCSAYYGVPVVFVSGDEGLCEHAKELVPAIETVGVKTVSAALTFNLAPQKACSLIKEGAKARFPRLPSAGWNLRNPLNWKSTSRNVSMLSAVPIIRGQNRLTKEPSDLSEKIFRK